MAQAAKAQEPSMEEILASIRRIIADDDAAKSPAPEPVKPPPLAAVPAPPPPPIEAPVANENLLDEMLADLNSVPPPEEEEEQRPPERVADVLDLTEAMAETPVPEPPAFQTIDGHSDLVFEDTPPAPEPPALHFQQRERRPLMSA